MEPIEKLSDAEFARTVNQGRPIVREHEPEEKKRNKARAQDELGHIEALSKHPSFQWFYDTAIKAGFRESRGLLETANTEHPGNNMRVQVASFQVWRTMARWLDERELQHRKLLDPKDPKIDILRERLDLQ